MDSSQEAKATPEVDPFDVKHAIEDTPPKLNCEFSASYKKSFAYVTFRERAPKIIMNIIETLEAEKDVLICKYGENAYSDIKRVITALTGLRKAILENKSFEKFYFKEPDTVCWNKFLNNLSDMRRNWFSAVWLHAECYMYRRISYIFKRTATLKFYDYFEKEKQNALFANMDTMCNLVANTRELQCNAKTFQRLLKVQLWGNRCDLSITEDRPTTKFFEHVKTLNDKLLVNESKAVWQCLSNADTEVPRIVDIVVDNAGFEFFTDLIMAEFMLDKGLADQVRFHLKAIPWYVSDVTHADVEYTLRFLEQSKSPTMSRLGKKLQAYMYDDKLVLADKCHFWTGPYEYYKMRDVCPCLYVKMTNAVLIIFKGDHNYRRLIGDYCYEATEPFAACIKSFQASNVCALRTIKADLLCGLPDGVAARLTKENPNWLYTGEYGVIQFATKKNPILIE